MSVIDCLACRLCTRSEVLNQVPAENGLKTRIMTALKRLMKQTADKPSCMNFVPHQLRMLLSSLAYTRIEAIQRLALRNAEWGK